MSGPFSAGFNGHAKKCDCPACLGDGRRNPDGGSRSAKTRPLAKRRTR